MREINHLRRITPYRAVLSKDFPPLTAPYLIRGFELSKNLAQRHGCPFRNPNSLIRNALPFRHRPLRPYLNLSTCQIVWQQQARAKYQNRKPLTEVTNHKRRWSFNF
jgi:hypothetical protein